MDPKKKTASYRNRFLKLTLKKNRLDSANDDSKQNVQNAEVIVLDESFENLMCDKKNLQVQSIQKVYSPIIIDDSIDSVDGKTTRKMTLSPIYSIPSSKEPSRTGNVSFNCTEDEQPLVDLKVSNRPSDANYWSPAQNIICATPKYPSTPSTPNDIANESFKECSLQKIEHSQKKLINELYGEIWKTMPALFNKAKKIDYDKNVMKKLDFSDDSDKENIKIKHIQNKLLYLTDSEVKRNAKIELDNTEKKSKKKLYTEKVPATPEPVDNITKRLKREVQTTTKKPKPKSVTELVEIMKNKHSVHDSLRKPENNVNSLSKKIQQIKISNCVPSNVKRLSFMGSLADNVPSWRCDIEALQYIDNYKTKREELTRRLYKDFNELVFSNHLDADMPVIWDSRLRSSAGITINRVVKTSKGIKICSSTIELSVKILDGPQRLRDTLIHEMCHAATWIIDKELKAGHGPLWKKWATRALRVFPELGEITRCHNMDIHFKYSYKCTKCGYSINRHSKSIDMTKKCCGYCRGTFELIVNKKNKEGVVVSTPARKGGANDFALYVKENYATTKTIAKSHAETMKILGAQFSAKKNKKNDS